MAKFNLQGPGRISETIPGTGDPIGSEAYKAASARMPELELINAYVNNLVGPGQETNLAVADRVKATRSKLYQNLMEKQGFLDSGSGGGGRSSGGGGGGGGHGMSRGGWANSVPPPTPTMRTPKMESPGLQVSPQRGGGGGMNEVQRAAMSAAMRYLRKLNPHLISSI